MVGSGSGSGSEFGVLNRGAGAFGGKVGACVLLAGGGWRYGLLLGNDVSCVVVCRVTLVRLLTMRGAGARGVWSMDSILVG